jgi:PAS domain S-box-containing protein
MGERGRLAYLILVLVLMTVITSAVITGTLYSAVVRWQRETLFSVASSQVDNIDNLAQLERVAHPGLSEDQLAQVIASRLSVNYADLPDFGKTGEVLIGWKKDGKVSYLASSNWQGPGEPAGFNLSSLRHAVPMQTALTGKKGTMTGLDYRGKEVLAAYSLAPSLKWGVVAKIDLAEIRQPFIYTISIVSLIALLLMALLSTWFSWATNPLIRRIAASERSRRMLLESTDAMPKELDLATGRWTYVAPQVERVLGYAPAEWSDLRWWIDHLHPDDQAWAKELYAHPPVQAESQSAEYRFLAKDGREVWIRDITVVEGGAGGPLVLRGFMFDITERKLAEAQLVALNDQLSNANDELSAASEELIATNEELTASNDELASSQHDLTRANRALMARGECNRALIHATDEQELFNCVCSILTETGGYELAWIGFARNDEAKSIDMVAAQGRAVGYAGKLHIGWGDNEFGQGPTGTAIRTKQLYLNTDTEINSQFGPWREAAREYGLRSSCVIPLCMDNGMMGALNLYADQPEAFTPEETRFLSQLATDLVFGIAVIHEREKRRQAEEALEAKSEALSSVNEELLAANEELTAANEEMRAINDDLDATFYSLGESQAELRKAKEYAERLIETASVIVVGLDRDGRVEMLNQATAQLLGYEKHELLGEDWYEIATPPDQRSELKTLYRNIRDGKVALPPQFTNSVLTKAGDLCEIEWQNSRFELNGEFAGCLAIGVDVTERKLAEQALSASEIRYRRLFETAKDGILILDAHTGVVVDVNPYLSELLGFSFDQLQGRKVWELGFLKDIAASRENFLELQKHEYIRYEDLPLETVDGQRIDAEFVSNVYQVNGNLVIQCNIRNITARKKAEKALHALHAELEQRVTERTAELAEANAALKLETVERMHAEEMQLTAVLEERTRIAREIHDTVAQGFAGIIIQLEAAEDILTDDTETAHIHLVKARQLARDSLTDARRSMWALRPQMLEKGDLVYAIATLVENMAKESSIHIEFSHQGERTKLPREIEDGLLRICQEALMNAGKHSQAQNIIATLLFEKDRVELRIEDDGRGFDATSAPFLRGLGLRVMKERAQSINGTVTITSKPGQGAQVIVQVPSNSDGNGGPHG